MNCFFLHVQQVVLPHMGGNPDLSGGGYTTASEVRGLQLDGLGVLFSAHFCSMPRKLAGCFVEDISHQRLPVQVLVFVLSKLILWVGMRCINYTKN